MCKSKKKKADDVNETAVDEVDSQTEAEAREVEEGIEERNFFIDSVATSLPPWRVELELEGSTVSFKIDTGADVNVVSKSTWEFLRKPRLFPVRNVTLSSPGGDLSLLGQFETKLNGQLSATLYVIDRDVDNLLSRATSTALGLVKRANSVAFSTVKCKPVKIKLKEGATPYAITTARLVPIPPQEKVKKELQRMKDCDIIEEITEPTEWVSPMVPVLKPNGDVRICVDLKRLNQAIQRERFVIPTFDDIIHQLRGSTIFSKLDAQLGFW